MPRPKHTKPGPAAATTDATQVDRPSTSRKTKSPPVLTHERIAADMAAFRKAGGRVEVLGVTRTLTKVDADPAASALPVAAERPKKTKR